MQQYYPPYGICKLYSLSYRDPAPSEPNNMYEYVVQTWDALKSKQLSDGECARILRVSRSTYYRYRKAVRLGRTAPLSRKPKRVRQPQWTREDEKLVLKVRQAYPHFGKAKLHSMLKKTHGFMLSESTVGRILTRLIGKHPGLKRSSTAPKLKRQRRFNATRVRKPKGMKSLSLGELVQIDHMTVNKNQKHFKHFMSWEPHSKHLHARVYSNATSRSARHFLQSLIETAPFTIKSIQVDGGSEFMGDFERACEALGLVLYVIPPRSPQANGGIERANRTLREEFYARPLLAETLDEMNLALQDAIVFYNTKRPHHSLKLGTPMAYINNCLQETANLSHMY